MSESKKWMALALVISFGWLLYLLAPVLTPFAIAALLAYLGDPVTDWLERRGLNRGLSVTLVFGVISLGSVVGLLVIVPLLQDQIAKLVASLPAFFDWAKGAGAPLLARAEALGLALPERDELVALLQEHFGAASGIARELASSLTRSGMAVLGWVMNLVLIPVVTFYLLRDWDVMLSRIRELIPRKAEGTVARLASDSNAVLGAFLRGQLSVMLALGAIYSLGLWLVGLDLAFLVGMLAGIISFVPYLGAIVGVVLGVVGALFQFGDAFHVMLVLAVFAVGQALEGMLLTPWLVGDRIGLHPVAVIFAVLAGGQLFGFLGILLALPAASVVMVMLRYAHEEYRASHLYGQPLADTGSMGEDTTPLTDGAATPAAESEPLPADPNDSQSPDDDR